MNTTKVHERRQHVASRDATRLAAMRRTVADAGRQVDRSTRSRRAALMRALLAGRRLISPHSSANSGSKRRSWPSGIRERHREVADDPAGPGRHHQHPCRQEHRLADRVGDEQPGEPLALEQAQQLVVQPLAGDLVEGAERLVEQEHLRVAAPASGPASSASSCRPTAAWGTSSRSRPGRPARWPRAASASPLGLGHALQLGDQLDVALHGAPRQQRGVLEDVADARSVDVDTYPPVWSLEAGGDAQQRALAAARRADHGDELAGRDVEATSSTACVPSGNTIETLRNRSAGAAVGGAAPVGGETSVCHHPPLNLEARSTMPSASAL